MIYEIRTDCFYTDMKKHLERYDTSDYPVDNIFGIPLVNKKVLGLFKDELKSQIMTEFVGLRSKMYSVKAQGVEKMKKVKGVKKYILKNEITFNDFLKCMNTNCTIEKNQNSIRSKLHTVYSIRQQKIVLSPFDNKRYILDNKVNTLPWGHYKVPKP